MEEALGRGLTRLVVSGQLDFGSAILIFFVICGIVYGFKYAIEKAQKGQPGYLVCAVGVILFALFLCAVA
jgi:hypothetical protein